MAEKDSRAMLYVGLGALAAAGAGYLVWRYVLTDETKQRAKESLKGALATGTETVKGLMGASNGALEIDEPLVPVRRRTLKTS